MLKKILFFLIIISNVCYSQLSNKHWLPPLHSRVSSVVQEHYIYLSTPEPTPFQVTITTGNGSPISGSPFTISQGNPVRVYINNQQPSLMFLDANNLNMVVNNKGLILEGTKEFYASFRVKSTNHAETLILKGRDGLGTEFRLGSLPQAYLGDARNFVASFMATEDDTEIDVSGYNTDVVFHSAGNDILSNTQNFTLDAGQVVVLSGYSDIAANLDGFVGALVTSSKPIVVNSGNSLAGMGTPEDGQDFTLDQIVPVEKVGTEYALVRGNGSNLSEYPLVIATQDNTQIYVNGNTTPLITLSAGQYYLVPNSLYQGTNNKNMYITSNNAIYMYQIIAGSISDATNGLNFIPPLSCFFQKSVDLIPSIDQIGTVIYDSDVIAITTNTAVLSINDTPVASLPEPLIGNNTWVTYKIENQTGDTKITSTGPLAVGVFGYSGVAGFGGYYSGFGSTPLDTDVKICSNQTINLLDAINGNPEPGGTWTSPSGGNPIVNNTFNPSQNIGGDYFYTFNKICDSSSLVITIKVNVTIEIAPFVGTSNSISICENNSLINLFDLLGPGAVSGGNWSPNLSSGNGIFNPSVDSSGIYTYSIPGTGICESSFAEINVTKNLIPQIFPISNYELCDNNIDGNDTNGFVTFNLTSKDIEAVGTQSGVVATYHTDPNDALLGQNAITSIYTNDRIIYVRLTNTATSCYSTTSFNLIVKPLPSVNSIVTLKQCDTDTDAVTDFNLTQANTIISTDLTNTFTYHNSQSGALNNNDLVTNDISHSAANGSIVWARITNTLGCFRVAQVNLIVSATTISQSYSYTIEECDDYISLADTDVDGIDYFNLTEIEPLLTVLFPVGQSYTYSYYLNEADAISEQNAITTFLNFRNTIPNNQTIWVRIESNLYECAGLGPFLRLIVNPLPDVNLDENFALCLDPVTGIGSQIVDATPATPGNYSYVWTPVNPLGNSPFYNITAAGTYSVVVTNIVTNCQNFDTILATFSSEPATFDANLITPAFSSGLATIEAIATGGFGVYEYSLNAIDWQSSPIFSELENGSYTVYVRDIQGCGLLASDEIQTITYPNYFTPNADGFNDTWIVSLPTEYYGIISIYDRYGKLIKQISANGNGWDGTYNGNLLPSTDYWFKVEYTENNKRKEFKSHFSLKR